MTERPVEQRPMMISDPQVMRALAHPARLEIMEHLTTTGAAVTATECAEIVGLSPSAVSYHLRELAKFGLVEQAPSRGDARERLWRSSVGSWGVEVGQDAPPEARAAQETLIEVYAARDMARVRDWARRTGDEPKEWYDAAQYGGAALMLTAEELTALNEAVRALMKPYRRRERVDPPEGARPVMVHYAALPMD
ncbi:ArsR/SmtB family transcription factor [Plantactinospora endophytica]|uniref:Transcriptional regulator n=1 Tax=Plantactinospora endophytica TaxID=673535 RepID=A0ABQ4E9Q6_9ACTN|nr:helix-turn-helix domain-containing protein [Plantactinospora endophytica]GIG91007.1 transcriptional regulator [Plantactinospora endophytica]